mgnify:FL=1|jgi:phosphoribosyl 1,2-cyclic phosphate phosphodiesterase|tara:strand:+ start:4081 stop:4854 length:774 start_codon:yes stop_codon:yes gene_type:complete
MTIKFTILGCGSSMGVPRPDGSFGKCNPSEKKNYRTRCGAIISSKYCNTLIDSSPDLRFQLLRNKIKKIDRVLYSHFHADQTHGINDLRIFCIKNKKRIPIYSDKQTKNYLLKSFKYCFKKQFSYPAILKFFPIKKKNYFNDQNTELKIRSVKVKHGNVKCNAFIINDKCAYLSDVSMIYQKDYKYFKNLKYLVIDCLRYNIHPSHYNLDQVLEIIKIFQPIKTILTNLHSDLDYNDLKKKLPKNISPAYDGLSFVL